MRKLIFNYLYSALYQLFAILVPLITTPYLTRVLGAYGLGSYAYEQAIASYFVLVILLGLKNYGNKVIAKQREDRELVSITFSNIYSMQIIMLVIALVLYVHYCMHFAKNMRIALIMILMLVASGIDITWFFSGLEEFKLIASRDFIMKILTTVSIFVFVKSINDTWKYALIVSVGTLISQLLLWPQLLKRVHFIKPTIKGISKHILPNLFMFVPIMAVNLYKTMDKVMLGTFSGEDEVGYYYSSEKVISVPMALISSLNAVMLPHMSHRTAHESDDCSIVNTVFKTMIFSFLVTSFIGANIIGTSEYLVPIVFGAGFEKCIDLFWILVPNCIIIAFTNVICYQFLIPGDHHYIYVLARVAGALVNLFANLILIRDFKALGAAIGTLITEVTVCSIQLIYVRKRFPILRMIAFFLVFVSIGAVSIVSAVKLVNGKALIMLLPRGIVCSSVYLLLLAITWGVVRVIHGSWLHYD